MAHSCDVNCVEGHIGDPVPCRVKIPGGGFRMMWLCAWAIYYYLKVGAKVVRMSEEEAHHGEKA